MRLGEVRGYDMSLDEMKLNFQEHNTLPTPEAAVKI